MSGVILATAIGSGVAAAGGAAAVGAAAIGAGTTLYGGAKSFSNANKARKRGEAAERAADKAIEEARRRVDVNAYEQLSIAKEPYELMRDALLTAGATGLQTGVEGETRGAAATAGRIQMAQNLKQGEVRAEMGQQMDELNRLVADEDKRRQQQLAGIAMEEAAGAQAAIRDAEEDRANYIAQGVGTLGSIAEGLSSSYAAGDFGRIKARGLAAESENVGELLAGLDAFGMPTAREQRQANRRAQENNMVDFPQPLSRSQQNQLERQGRRDLNDIQRAQAQAAIDPAFGGPVIPQDRTFNPNFTALGSSVRPDQYTAPGQAMSPRQTERMLMAQRRLGQQEARDIQRAIRRNPELLQYQAGGQGTSGPLDPFDPFGGGGFTPPSPVNATRAEARASVAPAGVGGPVAPAPAPERRPVEARTSITSGDRETARRRMEENVRRTSGLEGAELTKALESIDVNKGEDGKFNATYTPPTQESRAQVQSVGDSETARELLERLRTEGQEEIAIPNPSAQEIEKVNTEAVEKAEEVGPAAAEVVRGATENVTSSNPLPIAMQWLNVREPDYRTVDPVTGDSVYVDTPKITPEGQELLTEVWEGVGHSEKTQKEYIKKENAWCAGFVNKVLADSNLTPLGGKLSKQRADMYMAEKFGENVFTSEKVNRLNLHGNLKKFSDDYGFPSVKGNVKDAKMGDVVIINRPKKDQPDTRHVAFFAGFDEDGKIKLLGGNQNDEVNVSSYDVADVIGIRRVNQPDLSDKELEAVSKIVVKGDGATR
jgi:hypothetical protein